MKIIYTKDTESRMEAVGVEDWRERSGCAVRSEKTL